MSATEISRFHLLLSLIYRGYDEEQEYQLLATLARRTGLAVIA